jgi:hypothetical protein
MSETLSVKKRIVRIMNQLRLDKDGKNTFSNYDYFKPDDILRKLNPLLEENNLITIFNLKNNNEYYVAQLIVEDTESDAKVTYEFDISKATVKGANEAQNSGATMTYAKRYILMNVFNIADDKDDFDKSKKGKPPQQNQGTDDKKTEVSSILKVFETEFKVTKEQIETHLKKQVSKITDSDINNLRGIYTDIKANKKKVEEIFK